MFKCKKKVAPPIFHNFFTSKPENEDNSQSRGKLREPFQRKKRTQFNIDIVYRSSHLWNEPTHNNFRSPDSPDYSVRKSRNLY